VLQTYVGIACKGLWKVIPGVRRYSN